MAFDSDELARIEAIERFVNKLQVALKNMASQQQMRSLLIIKEKDINDLKARVDSLESQIKLLQQNSV